MHDVNLCSEIPTKRTPKGYENLPYHWTRFPAAKIIECFNWTVPPDRWKEDSTVYGMIPIKNRSRKNQNVFIFFRLRLRLRRLRSRENQIVGDGQAEGEV